MQRCFWPFERLSFRSCLCWRCCLGWQEQRSVIISSSLCSSSFETFCFCFSTTHSTHSSHSVSEWFSSLLVVDSQQIDETGTPLVFQHDASSTTKQLKKTQPKKKQLKKKVLRLQTLIKYHKPSLLRWFFLCSKIIGKLSIINIISSYNLLI